MIIDIHVFVRDPIPLSRNPELYQPLLIERLFHLPPPSVPLTVTLYLILVVFCLRGGSQWLATACRWGGGCRLYLVDSDRHELRQGRP